MRSIKPGRGPSGMSFIGSIIAVVFGVFWTIISYTLTSQTGFMGMIFPLFGVLFIIVGSLQAIYHYKNATGKNRFSLFDITDSNEEGDPSASWIRDGLHDDENWVKRTDANRANNQTKYNYCPYCGFELEDDFEFCPKCGKDI